MSEAQTVAALPGLAFDTSYERLPERFYAKVHGREYTSPELVKLNEPLAGILGLDTRNLDRSAAARVFSGIGSFKDGSLLAMAYSGHQFGHFNPTLGDGRAGLIGEVIGTDGERYDIQLKGSGPTPFSRGGDGFAALGPVMREYIVSEAMHALGIPTTRSLAVVLTGDNVYRDRVLPGAVLTRVAKSHLRIGTFQYFAARGDREGVKTLADYAINRHYPNLADSENRYLNFLKEVIERQAKLVAKWMAVGFIHGVMNTDNMTISGETIDFGPCAFMDHYEHNKVFSSIDQGGRYAYGAQPQIAQWNLARLAETLIPLIDEDEEKAINLATEAVQEFSTIFTLAWAREFGRKIGLPEGTDEKERIALIREFTTLLQVNHADYTTAYVQLTQSAADGFKKGALAFTFKGDEQLEAWMARWQAALEGQSGHDPVSLMKKVNPLYIPRNHLVEEAIRAGEDNRDFAPMEMLLQAVANPYQAREGFERYALPPEPGEEVTQTFCGT